MVCCISMSVTILLTMKQYFQIDPCIIHLNHAAVAPWPVATAQALQAFAQENASIGSQRYEHWLQCEDELRSKLARLINVENAEDIALLKSTSEGLSFIAYGLQWNAGDNIIIPEGEFPSNRVVWESLANQGVEVRQVSIKTDDPESALINAFDERTRLLSVSSAIPGHKHSHMAQPQSISNFRKLSSNRPKSRIIYKGICA